MLYLNSECMSVVVVEGGGGGREGGEMVEGV